MAQFWDNEPGGLGLSAGCFQQIHRLAQPINDFVVGDHALSPRSFSRPELETNANWYPPTWLSNLCQMLKSGSSQLDILQEANSKSTKSTSIIQTDTSEREHTNTSTHNQEEAAVVSFSPPINLEKSLRRRNSSREALLFSSQYGSRPSSSSNFKTDVEGRQLYVRCLSPKSSGSCTLLSRRDSSDLSDSFPTNSETSARTGCKRPIEQVDSPQCNVPTTSAATDQSRVKKSKMHFQDEELYSTIKRSIAPPQHAIWSGFDGSFKLKKQFDIAKADDSRKQEDWSQGYPSMQLPRTETIDLRGAERLKAALGPNVGGSRASTPASFVSNTPSKRGRGNGRRGRGRGGRGGRGRGGGRAGRNDDSPEPPKKKLLSEAEKEILADLKARQTELKKFFKEVGAYHNEALSLLITRDLSKIAKKSRAHEKVPEYQTLLDALHARKKEAEDFARKKYEYDLKEASILLDAEKEVIEQKFKTRCEQTKLEHQAGAQGDYLTAREAIQIMIDKNRTEPGSPDPNRFPRLHLFAQRQMVRGYNSQHITDETSLRRPPSSFDDTIRREVIDHDIISPTLFKALDCPSDFQARKISGPSSEHSAASSPPPNIDRDPSHDFKALAVEASRRLQELNDHLTTIPQIALSEPRPPAPIPQDRPLSSFSLSRLADAAESESKRMQLERNELSFMPSVGPVNHLEPWSGFASSSQPQPAIQNMPPQQWPQPMQKMSMSLPPRAQSSIPPSTLRTPAASHHFSPRLPQQQSHVSQFHTQQPEHHHQPPPLLPQYRQSQPPQLQHPQTHYHPQNRPPPPPPQNHHLPPAVQYHPTPVLQAQSQQQHYHHHHHHHHRHRPPNRQLQPHHRPSPPQTAPQTPTPVTFVHQTLSTPAPTPTSTFAASASVLPLPPPPPPSSSAPTTKTRKPRKPNAGMAQIDRNHHQHQHHHHHHNLHNLIGLQPQVQAKAAAGLGRGVGLGLAAGGTSSGTGTGAGVVPVPLPVPVPPPKGGQRMLLPKGS